MVQWEDIDFEKKEINVRHTLVYPKDIKDNVHRFKFQTPKSRASVRTIPMLPEVEKALRHQRTAQMRLRLFVGADWEPLSDNIQ